MAEPPVILYDGTCGFCNRAVQWVLQHDRRGRFHFAALQSAAGTRLLQRFGLCGRGTDSVVLLANGSAWTKSAAVIEIARQMGLPWSLAAAARWVPASLRDKIYDVIARNRHKLVSQDRCRVPTASEQSRFLR